ncbi:MAG: hypothetical protein JEZ08_05495 [Clostridiales bacterium]|nr:hypothetical protein [Clostridiales bacterium]
MDLVEIIEKKINELMYAFVDKEIVDFQLIEELSKEEDVRFSYKVATATSQYVLKLARNSFTTIDRVEKWSELSKLYRKLGYETPDFLEMRAGGHAFCWDDVSGRCFVVWCETFIELTDNKDRLHNDSKEYRASVGELIGRVASQSSAFEMYTPTPYCLFGKFCIEDPSDEYMEFMLKTYELLKGHVSVDQMYLEYVYQTFLRLRAELKQVYKKLPTAVFQSDLNESNLVLRNRTIKGLIDFNISGREVVLNYLINEGVYQEEQVIHELWLDKTYNQEVDEKFKWVIKTFSKYYTWTSEEKTYFPLVYKVIRPFKYLFFVGLVRSFKNEDYFEVNCRLKWMIQELERTDLHQMIEEAI